MIKKVVHYFDKLEDRVRGRLSRFPLVYTFIGGVGIVLFWRGVWMTADDIARFFPPEYVWLDGPFSVIVSCFILLITGLFVSFFVTDKIIVSGLKQEKKLVEKTELELRQESDMIHSLMKKIDTIDKKVTDLHKSVKK